jgi:hypothetical protein
VFCALQVVIDPACIGKTLTAFGIGSAASTSTSAEPSDQERHWLTCRAEFLELLEHARSLIAPTPELVAAFKRVTIVDTFEASAWIGAVQPAYKRGDRHWLNWKGDIYRR